MLAKSSKIVLSFDLKFFDSEGRNPHFSPLTENLLTLTANLRKSEPEIQYRKQSETTPKPLGNGRSFRTVAKQLKTKAGFRLSDAYIRDGKVVFIATKTEVTNSDLIKTFESFVANTGWSVFRYNNADGTVVFASKGAVSLPSDVKGKEKDSRVPRDWQKHIIEI